MPMAFAVGYQRFNSWMASEKSPAFIPAAPFFLVLRLLAEPSRSATVTLKVELASAMRVEFYQPNAKFKF